MPDQRDPASQSWHLDRRVPIALIVTLIAQGGLLAWWIGGLDERVSQHDRRITALEKVDDRRAGEMLRIEGRLSSLEATSREQLRTLERIESLLSRPPNREEYRHGRTP